MRMLVFVAMLAVTHLGAASGCGSGSPEPPPPPPPPATRIYKEGVRCAAAVTFLDRDIHLEHVWYTLEDDTFIVTCTVTDGFTQYFDMSLEPAPHAQRLAACWLYYLPPPLKAQAGDNGQWSFAIDGNVSKARYIGMLGGEPISFGADLQCRDL